MNVKTFLVFSVFIFSGCTSLSRVEARLNERLDRIEAYSARIQEYNAKLADELAASREDQRRLRDALTSLGESLTELDGYSGELDGVIKRIEERPSIDCYENKSP